jgi:photosystem II stability/assembly factor-like uncharacterized protein
LLSIALLLGYPTAAYAQSSPADFSLQLIPTETQTRIDAVAYLGKGVVLAGTRGKPKSGYVLRSRDFGATWQTVGNVTGDDPITCLCSGGERVGYLLTGKNVHVWKTSNDGETWQDLGQISRAFNGHFANAYGMIVTQKGTLLVADADKDGGRIHRSVDQGATWQLIGPISTHALYRLNEVGDGILANGWAGRIYKSTDDGATWRDQGRLIDSDLYAIEYVGQGGVLIGTKSGHVFRSTDNGETWTGLGIIGAAADDFAWLGGTRVLYSTYTADRSIYLSEDAGLTWKNLGGVGKPPGQDWLDHVIAIHDGDTHTLVAGTNKGFIVFARLPVK